MTPAARIAAVVAAAGRSTRMGEPKQLLPWQGSTVIATVVRNLAEAKADPVVVALGHESDAVATALAGTGARIVHNRRYREGEMLSSFQACLATLNASAFLGALLALGDQPHLPVHVLHQLIRTAEADPSEIIIPSHNMRRGHPIFLPASLWQDVLGLSENDTLRTLLNGSAGRIRYVNVDTPAVLRDMDTPDDYQALQRNS